MGAWVVVSGLDVNPLSGCDGEIEKRENRNCSMLHFVTIIHVSMREEKEGREK